MKKVVLLGALALLIPTLAHAQTLFTFLGSITNLIGASFPVIISLAILYFMWGLLKYILKSDSIDERANARSHMIWGVIIIFVMTSIWGLVNFLGGIFVTTDVPPNTPQLNTVVPGA